MSDEIDRPKSPLEYISNDQLQDMWGAGFTVIRRDTFGPDVYELADRVKRPGMSRQWVDTADVEKFKADGWRQVYCEDYHGVFAPFGYLGPIEIGGLSLFECPQHKVDKAKETAVAAAHKQVDDWKKRWGGAFSGHVTSDGETQIVGDIDTAELLRKGNPQRAELAAAWERMYAPESKSEETKDGHTSHD